MTIQGHEAEFRLLFAQEAEMRLARLGEQLLQLEANTSDPELVASIFREAHTLKGAAAVVGIEDASRIAHALEDILEELRSGQRLPTPELVDAALVAVDGLSAMIPRLLQGEDCAAVADTLTEQLRAFAAKTAPDAGTAIVPDIVADIVPEIVPERIMVVVSPERESARPSARVVSSEMETVMVPVSRLDELVRLVGESAAAHLRVGRMITERLDVDASTVAEFRDLSRVLNDLQERTMRARMVPVSTITDQLHRAVRDISRSLGKSVEWEVRGGDTELDRGVLQQLADPLLHLVRNAVDHGIETPAERLAAKKPQLATLRLHAMQLGSEVIITVTDDGRGIDVDRVREEARERGVDDGGMDDDEALHLIFRSGLSTARFVSDVSGRGVGLDIVRTHVETVRGRIEVRSQAGSGSEFRIVVPITLAVLPCLLIASGGHRYAIPMHSVLVSQAFDHDRQAHAEGRPMVWVGDDALPVAQLRDVLGLGTEPREDGPLVVIAGATRRHAFQVDALLGQRDVVVKGLGQLLPRLDVLAGASVEPDGSILLVLDAAGLIDRARLARTGAERIGLALEQELTPRARHGSVLVVDDALTVRELQRSILERAGFDVRLAGDGIEALALLAEEPSDLVLTDVEMPRMNGFALTEAIRAQPTLANMPVLILTSLSNDEDRQRGLEAGADGYIVKAAFDEAALLSAVDRLLGRRP